MLIIRYLFMLLAVWGTNILPDECAVCSYVPLNGPCIVNTSTGDIWDVQVFPPRPNISNAIYEKEEGNDYGYCWLQQGLGYKGSGIALPDNNKAELGIREEALSAYNPVLADIYLCQACLDKLNKLEMTNNFAVADVYGLAEGRVEFYALTPVSDFWLRHYHVFVVYDEYGGLDIEMKSTYFEGGKELDY